MKSGGVVQIVQKVPFLNPHLEIPKDIAVKIG